jgi:hypothetical protein
MAIGGWKLLATEIVDLVFEADYSIRVLLHTCLVDLDVVSKSQV